MLANFKMKLRGKCSISVILILISVLYLIYFQFGVIKVTSYPSSLSYFPSIFKESFLMGGPLILANTWWKNKRIWFAPVFLAILLLFTQIFSISGFPIDDNYYFSMLMFIFIIVIIAFLSERIEKVRSLTALNEKLAREKMKLEDANKELDAFAYSVSHDLRTPLRAIDGFSRILMEDYEDELDNEGKRIINVIRDSTLKMGQLIDDILKLSRISRQEIRMSEIDMENLVKLVFDELKVPNNRDIQLDLKYLPLAYGDRTLIQQVFSNLISNSIKFTQTQEKTLIEVGGSIGKDESIYYVKDNGVGFDMRYVNKLFGLFQRLHSQEEFEGTGVGLSIVQRIIKRHNGRVWGEGKVDGGATIYFTLPLNR